MPTTKNGDVLTDNHGLAAGHDPDNIYAYDVPSWPKCRTYTQAEYQALCDALGGPRKGRRYGIEGEDPLRWQPLNIQINRLCYDHECIIKQLAENVHRSTVFGLAYHKGIFVLMYLMDPRNLPLMFGWKGSHMDDKDVEDHAAIIAWRLGGMR